MAVFLHVNLQNRRNNVTRRVFKDRMNPLDYMGDAESISKYRIFRGSIFHLCNVLGWAFYRHTFRNHAFPVSLQIILALRFYATVSFQSVIADSHGVGILSVSRNIHRVSTNTTTVLHTRRIPMPDEPDVPDNNEGD
ncbi:hypothetical protein MAR_035439, partial [Mya arenaria]